MFKWYLRHKKLTWSLATLSAVSCTVTGCGETRLLITRVPGRRTLAETELSRDSLLATDKIALLDVSGILMNQSKPGLLSQGEHPVSLLLEQLDKARHDRRVKAVMLRINSPGGTVVAAELMHDEITRFREGGKPVIAVMMDVAASGAYYIACACDEIVAQRSTVTGGIGVVMPLFDISGAMDTIGVKHDAITSGRFKDTGSPWRTMRPEERELLQNIVNDMYGRFVDVVAAGRPALDRQTVRRLADGRVYTAPQALEAGLIDRIATLHEAVTLTKKRVGARRVRLVTYHRPLTDRPNYYALSPLSPGGDINLINIDLPAFPAQFTPRFMYLWAPGLY